MEQQFNQRSEQPLPPKEELIPLIDELIKKLLTHLLSAKVQANQELKEKYILFIADLQMAETIIESGVMNREDLLRIKGDYFHFEAYVSEDIATVDTIINYLNYIYKTTVFINSDSDDATEEKAA